MDAPSLPMTPAAQATWSGPRTWWGGLLDVEGLALDATATFAAALTALTGRSVTFDSARVCGWFDSFSRLRVGGERLTAFDPLSGFFPAIDGWVRTHANYPHHRQALLTSLGVEDADSARIAMRRLPAAEIEEAAFAAEGIAVAVRPPSSRAASESEDPWIRFAPRGEHATFAPSEGPRPLDGLRVLDLTRVVAGPSATRLLGALGADVLRVDPPHLPELPAQHLDTGFAKRSAVAPLDELAPLLDDAHVVMLGYRKAGLAKHGFDTTALLAAHPHLAVVAIDAWGTVPGWAGRRGFDSVVQAATGIAHLYSRESDDGMRPGSLPVQALDMATGLGMAAAALALVAEGGGSSRLSLVRTARELLSRGRPPSGSGRLEPPPREVDSVHGRLTYAPPPVTIDGVDLDYPAPPGEHGTDRLAWR